MSVWQPAAEIPGLPPDKHSCHEDPTSCALVVKRLVLRRFPKLAKCHKRCQYASARYFERAVLQACHALMSSRASATLRYL